MKLVGEKVYLRFLKVNDAKEALELQLRNKEFFQSFSPLRPMDFYTLEKQVEIIKINAILMEKGEKYSFGIFLKEGDELIGNVTLSEIVYGPLQSCYVGYTLDRACNGRGYMTEAVKLVVDFAFKGINLHRIEAGVMPRNIASARVLEKAGFHREGTAIKNVSINGIWEDHQIFAIISNNFQD